MVKEPFWLGLITVGTVLLIILMVYCVKRKFADKIEKFLADEIERSKNSESPRMQGSGREVQSLEMDSVIEECPASSACPRS